MTDEIKPEEKKEPDLIEKANIAAERLEKANMLQIELLKRQEEMLAKQALSGKSEAGFVKKEESKEEQIKKEAMEFLKGTSYNPFK